jgi:hypothetical protein
MADRDRAAGKRLVREIRIWIAVFVAGLVVSGLTALPIEAQLDWLARHAHRMPAAMAGWVDRVHEAVRVTNAEYPFLQYGTDWLAFGHFAIAAAFIGPFRDPLRHRWIVRFGMIICIAVVPYALVMGGIRGIPLFWRWIDCAFGIIGIIPLYLCDRRIEKLGKLRAQASFDYA